jgi:hypothetical protein
MKLEVGKSYETKHNGAFECIVVTKTHAWMKSAENETAYVRNQEGKSVSLNDQWDIKPQPREYWLCDLDFVYGYPVPGTIHVREVLPE